MSDTDSVRLILRRNVRSAPGYGSFGEVASLDSELGMERCRLQENGARSAEGIQERADLFV